MAALEEEEEEARGKRRRRRRGSGISSSSSCSCRRRKGKRVDDDAAAARRATFPSRQARPAWPPPLEEHGNDDRREVPPSAPGLGRASACPSPFPFPRKEIRCQLATDVKIAQLAVRQPRRARASVSATVDGRKPAERTRNCHPGSMRKTERRNDYDDALAESHRVPEDGWMDGRMDGWMGG